MAGLSGGTALEDQLTNDIANARGGRRRGKLDDPYSDEEAATDTSMPSNDPGQGTTPPVTSPHVTPGDGNANPKPATNYATIAGLDTAKLQDLTHNTYKYNAGSRAFSTFVGGGGNVARGKLDDLVAYARTNGNPNAKAVGDDKIDFGDGSGPVDIITSGGGLWWGQEDPGGEGTNQGTGTGVGSFAGDNVMTSIPGGGGGVPAIAPSPNAGTNGSGTGLEDMIAKLLAQHEADRAEQKGFRDKIHSTISSRIDAAGQPIDENAPDLVAQRRSFAGGQEQALGLGREAMAARAAHEGLPTGAFDSSVQSSYENAGKDRGAYNAQLLGQKYKDQLGELQNLLSMGAGVMSDDETRNVQTQIAALQARLKEMDLTQAGNISSASLANQSRGLDLDALRIGNQNNQFYDTMGLQVGDREAALNSFILNLLHGGR